jgi:hypothetical protein
MLDALITSKTRIKLLLKFFLNPENAAHLRGLETEFGESTNGIRLELNRLEQANMILATMNGNKKLFQVNQQHPLYDEIHSIVRKFMGLDVIVDHIAKKLGNLQAVYLSGDLVNGKDSAVIDLVLIGEIDESYLVQMVRKAEEVIKRRICYLCCERRDQIVDFKLPVMLLWQRDG